jgi:hypothetical protein
MASPLHFAPTDLTASNDIENKTDSGEHRDPDLFVGGTSMFAPV